eukprot:5417713-Alexandrium_andersonii.AAC.1
MACKASRRNELRWRAKALLRLTMPTEAAWLTSEKVLELSHISMQPCKPREALGSLAMPRD